MRRQLNTASQPGDHWHSAYGIFICGEYMPEHRAWESSPIRAASTPTRTA